MLYGQALAHLSPSVPQTRGSPWSRAQFSSVQSCPTLFDPIHCSMPCFPVYHQFPELTQTHVYQVSDAIQPWVQSPGSTEGLPAFAQGGDLLLYAVFIAYNKGKATSPTGLSFSTAPPSSSVINIPAGGAQPEGEDNDSTTYILETWALFTQPPTNANPLHACPITQPCLTLCHPLDCSLPGSSVHGIFNGNPFQYSCLENAMDRGAR